jgi:hypothetical protein
MEYESALVGVRSGLVDLRRRRRSRRKRHDDGDDNTNIPDFHRAQTHLQGAHAPHPDDSDTAAPATATDSGHSPPLEWMPYPPSYLF